MTQLHSTSAISYWWAELRPASTNVIVSRATHAVETDAPNLNWQAVFNHAYDHSLLFDPGDTLPHGCISTALQATTATTRNSTAGKVIQHAVRADELRETKDGYEIVRDGPGTGGIRQSLQTQIRDLMRDGKSGVIVSPTSSGKTHTPSTTRWRSHPDTTGGQPVILFSGTTNARDDAHTKSRQSHASPRTLQGRNDACPLARGDYDKENTEGNAAIRGADGSDPSTWFKTMCNDRGLLLAIAHSEFERAYDGQLPCCADGCPATTQWDDLPRRDDGGVGYDVLHATHAFAHVPQLIEDCNLVFDERPDFTLGMGTGRVRDIVTSYLSTIDAPTKTWERLMVDITGREAVDHSELLDALEMPETDWFRNDRDAHALAPGMVRAIVTAEERPHKRWMGCARYTYPTLTPGYDGPEQEVIIRVVFDSSNNIQLLQAVPDFEKARSVIGLDAHPTMAKWQGNTVMSIEPTQIVAAGKRQQWRQNQRNLHIVQVGDYKNSWTKGGFNPEKVGILCEELRQKYGTGFSTGITAKNSVDDLEAQMTAAGIETPDILYFGMEKSVEDFDAQPVGLVAGCISPSSEDTKNWLALLDKEADPKREVKEGYRGQKWVGPDADVAEELLADVRENGVLQAVGRYARSPQQPDDRATVYVLSNVLPDGYVDEIIDDVRALGKKQQQILKYVATEDGVTPATIAENVDCSKRHVHDTLKDCLDSPWLTVEERDGNNGNLYSADRAPTGRIDV